MSPAGWIDVQNQQWDLTANGMGFMGISAGLGSAYRPNLVTDGVRLVNDGSESYVEYFDPHSEQVNRIDVSWDSVTVAVPEPSSFVVLLIGSLAIIRRRRS